MAKWISSGVFGDPDPPIKLHEIHTTRNEAHSILNSNPVFKARLAVKWDDLSRALSELLGKPQIWPYANIFGNAVRASNVELRNDGGAAFTDTDGETLTYQNYALFDVTYLPRKGLYFYDYNNQEVYIEDVIQPRYDAMPMDHTKLIWGLTSDTAPTEKIPLHPNEAPPRGELGWTFVRTIEGWCREIPDEGPVIGTVNQHACASIILNRSFAAKTLKLRSLSIDPAYSFRSYRMPNPAYDVNNPIEPPDYEMSGKPTPVIRLQYEYRKETWEKFWRNSITSGPAYYYMRQNASPWDIVRPFPEADHRPFLGEVTPP